MENKNRFELLTIFCESIINRIPFDYIQQIPMQFYTKWIFRNYKGRIVAKMLGCEFDKKYNQCTSGMKIVERKGVNENEN